MSRTKRLAILALSLSLSLILSYIEFLLPPVWSAVPGIKLGLANIVIIFLMYRLDAPSALAVSVLRVVMTSLLFGSVMTFAYSIAGALLSFAVMLLLKRVDLFSVVGVSISGGVSHNLGQVLMAIIILGTREIGYYMAVLAITGTVAGVLIGTVSSVLIKKIKKVV